MTKKVRLEKENVGNKKALLFSIIGAVLALIIIVTTLCLVFLNKNDHPNNLFSKGLVAVKFSDGWGYINKKGDVVISGQFSEATPFSDNGLALVKLDGYYGFINTKGKYVVNPIYSDALPFNNSHLTAVKRNGKYGYINEQGKTIIPLQFDEASDFCYDLALVKIGGKYGFINEKGDFVINPSFDEARSFNNSKLTVVGKLNSNKEMMYACVSKKGKLLTDFMLNAVYVSEKYVLTFDGVYYGLCGLDLVPLFKTSYQIANFPISLDPFYNLGSKLIPFRDGETYKYGYLNLKGQVVIPATYDMIGNFNNGLAMVKKDNKYGFIDTNGKLVVSNKYSIARPFSEGYAVVGNIDGDNTSYGLIDKNGNVVLDIVYYDLGNVTNGLSYFTTFDSKLIGYINPSKKVVVPQEYTQVSKNIMAYDVTDDGYIVVRKDDQYGILTKDGKFLVNPYLVDVKY